MGDDVWLAGVYRGELVTVNEHYKKEFWVRLPSLRSKKLLEYSEPRSMLLPFFFFLKPAENAIQLDAIKSGTTLEDYGLSHVAYKALEQETATETSLFVRGKMLKDVLKEGVKIPAKGLAKRECFVVEKAPQDVLHKLKEQEEKICVLALMDKDTKQVRTGTFFKYDVKNSSLRFTPLIYRDRYLVGKGVLLGIGPIHALLPVSSFYWMTGSMTEESYSREKDCPLNICSSRFETEKGHLFITYRSVETDLRMDMPATYLYLARVRGFKSLAENLGSSLNHAFSHKIHEIDQRNVLADGSIVDYEVARTQVNRAKVKRLVDDVFRILFLSAVTSIYHGKGLLALLQGFDKDGSATKELAESHNFVKRNFKEINGRYQTLVRKFLGGLDASNRKYFIAAYEEGILPLEEAEILFKYLPRLTA